MLTDANPVLVAVVAGIVVLGLLILVHELGHFLAAKAVGIAVLRFSIGLGPRTPVGVKIGETDYCLSWIPFGGFVKMAGMEEEGAAGTLEGPRERADIPRERTFDGKPLWARVIVMLAGVAMNALFAVAVYAVLAGAYGVPEDPSVTVDAVDTGALPLGAAALGELRPGDRIVRIDGEVVSGWRAIQNAILSARGPQIRIWVAGRAEPLMIDVPRSESESRLEVVRALRARHEPVIGEVVSGQRAAQAGLERGDRIVRAAGEPIPSWEAFVRVVERHPERPLALVVDRGGGEVTLTVTPRRQMVRETGGGASRTVGRIGVAVHVPVRRYGVLSAVGEGFGRAGQAGGLVIFALRGLVSGQLSARDVGGPILVGQLSGEVARLGLEPFLSFIALFSMNLAVLNLLPIPVLDGGHLVFLLIEGLRGRPLSLEQRHRLTQLGFFVLVGIMALALANDVLRLIPR